MYYVCMQGVYVCVRAHAHVYTKHPLTHPFTFPSNYKFSELPMREPNTAFSTSRFMTANHPHSCVYRLFSYFKNWIRMNSGTTASKGRPYPRMRMGVNERNPMSIGTPQQKTSVYTCLFNQTDDWMELICLNL